MGVVIGNVDIIDGYIKMRQGGCYGKRGVQILGSGKLLRLSLVDYRKI